MKLQAYHKLYPYDEETTSEAQTQYFERRRLTKEGTTLFLEDQAVLTLGHAIAAFVVFYGQIYVSTTREVFKYSAGITTKIAAAPFVFCYATPSFAVLAAREIYLMTYYRIRRIALPPSEIRRYVYNLLFCRGFCFDCISCGPIAIRSHITGMRPYEGVVLLKESEFVEHDDYVKYARGIESYQSNANLQNTHLGSAINYIRSQVTELTTQRVYSKFSQGYLCAALKFIQ